MVKGSFEDLILLHRHVRVWACVHVCVCVVYVCMNRCMYARYSRHVLGE